MYTIRLYCLYQQLPYKQRSKSRQFWIKVFNSKVMVWSYIVCRVIFIGWCDRSHWFWVQSCDLPFGSSVWCCYRMRFVLILGLWFLLAEERCSNATFLLFFLFFIFRFFLILYRGTLNKWILRKTYKAFLGLPLYCFYHAYRGLHLHSPPL